jgi:hypothetical protein
MQDFFQILIWLLIIISILSSVFKKKETPKQQAPRPGTRPDEEREQFPVKTQSASTVDDEEYDILREIESLFKTNTSQPTKIEQKEGKYTAQTSGSENKRNPSEYTSYETVRNPSEYTSSEKSKNPLEAYKIDTSRRQNERELTYSEHTLGSTANMPVVIKAKPVDASVEKQAKEFERYLSRKETHNTMAEKIRNKIKQPSSFKEYLIMSEILGQPAYKTGGRAFRKANYR